MSDANPKKEASKSADPASAQAPAAAKQQAPAEQIVLEVDENSKATYSNLCRITGTPEELIMDFALHPNQFGKVLKEAVKVDHRIVMSYQAAKRTAIVLSDTIRRYEERFGQIELNVSRRLQGKG